MPRFDLYDDAIGFIAFRRTRAGAERTADAEANRCGRPVAILEHGRRVARVHPGRRTATAPAEPA